MIAYFHRENKWADCVGITAVERGCVYYRSFHGTFAGEKMTQDFDTFSKVYRIIYAEDFAEERERLIELIKQFRSKRKFDHEL